MNCDLHILVGGAVVVRCNLMRRNKPCLLWRYEKAWRYQSDKLIKDRQYIWPKWKRRKRLVGLAYGVLRHFQQYFSNIAAASFIGEGNWSTMRKPPTCRKSLTNFIT